MQNFIEKLKEILQVILYFTLIIGIPIIVWKNVDLIMHKYYCIIEDEESSKLIYNPIIQNNHSVNGIDNVFKVTENEKVMSNKLDNFNDVINRILDTTGNTISYFSAIIAALALLAGLAMWKYYKRILTTEERIKALNNSVLENALITLYAVPFVGATQITSSEHLDAIRYIAESVKNREEDIKSDPKYAPLFLCQGLYDYFEGKYEEAIDIMKEAEKLLKYSHDPFKKVVSFHLARTYKQLAYHEILVQKGGEERIKNYLSKAEYYKEKSPSWLKESLKMSIEAIKVELNNHQKNSTSFLCSLFKKPKGAKTSITNLENYLKDIVTNSDPNQKYSFNRMTAIPLWLELHVSKLDDTNKGYANDFLEYMKSRLQGQSGDNILASWHFSIARIHKKLDELEKARINLALAFSHYEAIERRKGIKTLFIYDCLAEIDKKKFKEKMEELKKQLNNSKG